LEIELKKSMIALLVLLPSMYASASELSNCTANKGTYLTGIVISAPRFASSSSTRDGIKLTHTRLNLRGSDGRTYDVAMDNVFAVDYVKNATSMPRSLAAIKVNDKLGLCGLKYPDNTGIHWVHTNCGDVPTTAKPNGSVKLISSSGSVGANLERSQTYCAIFD
jgi:hypothetical protein